MSAVTKVQDSVAAQAKHWQTRRKRELEELRSFITECDLSEMFQHFLEKKKQLLHPSGDGGDDGDDADPGGDDNSDEETGNLKVMYQSKTGPMKETALKVFFGDDFLCLNMRHHLRHHGASTTTSPSSRSSSTSHSRTPRRASRSSRTRR